MTLDLLVLRCTDIEKSKSFYELLGFSFEPERHGTGPEHYVSTTSGFVFELYPRKDSESIDNVRLGFSVSNI